jgi:hypothetical protein
MRRAAAQELTPFQALDRRPGPMRPRLARLRFRPPHRSPPVADSSGAGSRHVPRGPDDPSPYSIRQNGRFGITVRSRFSRALVNSPACLGVVRCSKKTAKTPGCGDFEQDPDLTDARTRPSRGAIGRECTYRQGPLIVGFNHATMLSFDRGAADVLREGRISTSPRFRPLFEILPP